MINKNELNTLNLSATKKDYYQIWNELIDLAGKISERWDPKSTNESDPGIVLLKVLTALGDKLNYNIDMNIAEAFMPTAAQMDSMQKLCDMMGYNLKYYQSATTDISISYTGDFEKFKYDNNKEKILNIPAFTSITNTDKDINFLTIENKSISREIPNVKIKCIEGQLVKCETENNNMITLNQLDDEYRYYLPETQIAENGLFVRNLSGGKLGTNWLKVDNLNTQKYGSRVFKFGFDSKLRRPYLEFPTDIGQIIEDGLEIYYIRTSGIAGNISARTLVTFEKPSGEEWKNISTDDFELTNLNAAVNGSNIETITQAYNNYKKTIGTFDTLVTCRDYMNKIYELFDTNNNPIVSNIKVTDIRDDINNSINLCTFNEYGICYLDTAKKHTNSDEDIQYFDLILYPFKTIYGTPTKESYKESFQIATGGKLKNDIELGIRNNKTIAHNIKYNQKADDIACIKNYLKLDARITTTNKVNSIEEKQILTAVKNALYKQFNARMLDFGEEIPFESILSCIENADSRIKNVALDEPELVTAFETISGNEYNISEYLDIDDSKHNIWKKMYNFLTLKNILAGKLELFKYDKSFSYDFTESNCTIYPVGETKIEKLRPEFKITPVVDTEITLAQNEIIQFRAPSFSTKVTYPAYVNYYLKLGTSTATAAVPATFKTLKTYMSEQTTGNTIRWETIVNDTTNFPVSNYKKTTEVSSADTFNKAKDKYGALFTKSDSIMAYATAYAAQTDYYYYPLDSNTFVKWVTWIKTQDGKNGKKLYGLFRVVDAANLNNISGRLIDVDKNKYKEVTSFVNYSTDTILTSYYVQDTTTELDGLGKNAELTTIKANSEYSLKSDDALYINYTPASTEDNKDPSPENITWSSGTIIRPNFDLVASNNNQKPFSKTKGFTFTDLVEDGKGMYTLGPSEKIEIVDKVEVSLKDRITYLYWILKDVDKVNDIFANASTTGTAEYTLDDGEYLFYTNNSKVSMAYYGSGTVINAGNSFKINEEGINEISAADILENGIESVPWIKYDLDVNNLLIKEYKYITLTENDTVKFGTGVLENNTTLDSNWTSIDAPSNVLYTFNGENSQTLTESTWEVCTKLALNVGPNKEQQLTKNDYIFINDDTDNALTETTIKTNYLCQTVAKLVDTKVMKLDVTGVKQEINDFKLKSYTKNNTGYYGKNTFVRQINFHNFGDIWTSISFKAADAEEAEYAQIYAGIPENNYGLLMISYNPEKTQTDITKAAYIIAEPNGESESSTDSLAIFNNHISSATFDTNSFYIEADSWWDGGTESVNKGTKYYLKNGLNIIVVKKSCSLKIYPSDDSDNRNNPVVMSDLDIIPKTKYLNSDIIKYYPLKELASSTVITGNQQLLDDLNVINADNKFYYNCPMENSTSLYVKTSMRDPLIWYDYNNINNNFVISEIDADYLDTGIKISRTSKLKGY